MVNEKSYKYKKQYQRYQQTVKSSDKLYRKSLQDKVFDKNENEYLCNFLLSIWMKRKMNLFYKNEHKNKINFCDDNLIFNLEPGYPRTQTSSNLDFLEPISPRIEDS